MKPDERQNHHKTTIKLNHNELIILFSVAWAAIEIFWRLPFTSGNVGGIYWLFYYYEKLSHPLAMLLFVLMLFLVIVAVVMAATKHEQYTRIVRTIGALFFASLLVEIATFQFFEPFETRHLGTLKIHDQFYYLTAYSAFDTNYALYQCDSMGIFCKQVYRSHDFMPELFYAKLVYYPTKDELAIDVKDEGEIYRYKFP